MAADEFLRDLVQVGRADAGNGAGGHQRQRLGDDAPASAMLSISRAD